jgi:uroporphyrinogen III methyltransferase/synthase
MKDRTMDKTPLQGKRILITRARDQAGGFSTHLGKLGAEVIEFPTIESSLPPLGRAGPHHRSTGIVDWIIFTSANGKILLERLREKGKEDHFPSL